MSLVMFWVSLEASGGALESLWVVEGMTGDVNMSPVVVGAHLGALGWSRGCPEATVGLLGLSVGSLRDLRALRGAPWGAWRRSLGALGFVLGSHWGYFGITLVSFWGHHGIILGSFWIVSKQCRCHFTIFFAECNPLLYNFFCYITAELKRPV